MRQIAKSKYQPHKSISEQDWFNHFQKVLEQDNQDQDPDDGFKFFESDVYYDRPITREEVLIVIQWLKNGKAEGPDGIISELFKHAGHLAVDLIIIIRNTYIAPNPTRLVQSTSQFKIRMNVRINT